MKRLRQTALAFAIGAALAAPSALAAELPQAAPSQSSATTSAGTGQTLQQGDTLTAPAPAPEKAAGSGGTSAGGAKSGSEGGSGGEGKSTSGSEEAEPTPAVEPEITVAPIPTEPFAVPSLPSSSCASSGVPPVLIPIYQRAAQAYGLGLQGPAVLAGINEVETGFGTNLNVSSAGAMGWMQFIQSTWEMYGVDANGDGVRDPYNPEDAIFAAARYLSAAGMPSDTYGAIYSYNHADWYVSEVLANAGCYAQEVDGTAFTAGQMTPQLPVLECEPDPAWHKTVPPEYLTAFEAAASRYELGRRGVWALAAIARLESNFGRGMDKEQMEREGPLGLDPTEWSVYAVDGDEDGRIEHSDPADSAATLARLIWSRGSLRAGIFTHNQAEWYVQEVLEESEQIEGSCKTTYVDWRIAPLGTGFETPGPEAVLMGNLASAPQSAPPAVKAAIEAANSISTTPYIWGGGHGSWYSSGYDCSGAVSFALYGAGLLDTPLTSGELESYGEPGPGRWITIYASPTHTYAVIAGLRWDTVGDAHGTGPRWHTDPPYPAGFVVRHPAGY